MRRGLYYFVISILMTSSAAIGCTTYVDDEKPVNPNPNPDNGGNNNGGNNNGWDQEEDSYDLITPDVGKICSSAQECSLKACDGRCLGRCNIANNCASGMICDDGICRSIVGCPDNRSESCFMTMSLTPSSAWLGSELSETTIGEEDFLSPYYEPILPKNEPENENYDIMFCIKPMSSILNINLSNTKIGTIYKILYSNEEQSALYGKYSTYVRNVTYTHFAEYDEFGKIVSTDFCFDRNGQLQKSDCKVEGKYCCSDKTNRPSHCFDKNGEKTDCNTGKTFNTYTVKGGDPYNAVYWLHISGFDDATVLVGLTSAFNKFYNAGWFSDSNKRLSVNQHVGKIMMQIGSLVADPRGYGRRDNPGCTMIPIQRQKNQNVVPFEFRYSSEDPKYSDRPIYWEVEVSNSPLMTNNNRFILSLGSSEEEDKMTEVKAYKKSFEFPIKYTAGGNYNTTATAKGAVKNAQTYNNSNGLRRFYFKANYKNNESFLCNEFDISSEICPGTVTLYNADCTEGVKYNNNGTPIASTIPAHCQEYTYNGTTYYWSTIQTFSMDEASSGDTCSNDKMDKHSEEFKGCNQANVSFNLNKVRLYIQIDMDEDEEMIME